FNNNTVIPQDSQDNTYIDILFSDFIRDWQGNILNFYTVYNNTYTNNALNVSQPTVSRSSDNENGYINVTVTLRDVYNSTVTNGTIRVTTPLGDLIGDFPLVNGTCNITIPLEEISPYSVDDLLVGYISDYKHYQNYRRHSLSVNADPKIQRVGHNVKIFGTYESYERMVTVNITGGDSSINERVSLYLSDNGQPGELVKRYIELDNSGTATVTISATMDQVNNWEDLKFIALYDNIENGPTLNATATGATSGAEGKTIYLKIGSDIVQTTTDVNGFYEYDREAINVGEIKVLAYTESDSATTSYFVTKASINVTAVPEVDRLNDHVKIYGYLDYVGNVTFHVRITNASDNNHLVNGGSLNITLGEGEDAELLASNIDAEDGEFDVTVYISNKDMNNLTALLADNKFHFIYNETENGPYNIQTEYVSNQTVEGSNVTITIFNREYHNTTDADGYFELDATALEYGRTRVLAEYEIRENFEIYDRTYFHVIKLDWEVEPKAVNITTPVKINGSFDYIGYVTLNISVYDPVLEENVTECTVNITDSDGHLRGRYVPVENGKTVYDIYLSREDRQRVDNGTLTFIITPNEHDYYTTDYNVTNITSPSNITFNLMIDGVNRTVTTDIDEYFEVNYTPTRYGKVPVIAFYEVDEDTVFSKNLTFNVVKLTVEPTPESVVLGDNVTLSGNLDYVSNVTIKVKVTTSEHFEDDWVDDGRVNITVNDGTSYLNDTRVLFGEATATITLTNEEYNRGVSTNFANFFTLAYSGDDEDTATCTYEVLGYESILGKEVTLNLNTTTQTTTVTVDRNGDYSTTLNTSDITSTMGSDSERIGTVIVNASHLFDNAYPINATNTFEITLANQLPTNITIDAPQNYTVGEASTVTFRLVNITALTDSNVDNPGIADQRLTVTITNGTLVGTVPETDENGYTTISFIPESTEGVTIVVHYDGNDDFEESTNQTTIPSD
ncbi:MAG: hypothetical protein BZ136_02325, partial [Methanosphaera sp. rholeuAM74]